VRKPSAVATLVARAPVPSERADRDLYPKLFLAGAEGEKAVNPHQPIILPFVSRNRSGFNSRLTHCSTWRHSVL